MTGTMIIYVIIGAVLLVALLTYLMMQTLKAQMTAESERVLKAREQQLELRAKDLFENLSAGLDKDIRNMKDAFEQNRKAQVESSISLKESPRADDCDRRQGGQSC